MKGPSPDRFRVKGLFMRPRLESGRPSSVGGSREQGLEDYSHSVLVDRGGNVVDGSQYVRVTVGHRVRRTRPGKHRQVVRHVAKGDDIGGADPALLAYVSKTA